MATITPTNPPSPPLPQLQSSLCSLATAAHILDGFAHRNKNQHRSTKWWAPFDMLRRTLRKILPDLEAAVQRAEIISSAALGGPPGKRRKTGGGGGGAGAAARGKPAKQPELDRVVERATWTRDVVKTRAYEYAAMPCPPPSLHNPNPKKTRFSLAGELLSWGGRD